MSAFMRPTPFKTKIPVEATAGSVCAWIPEGGSKPAQALSFGDSLELEEYKMAMLVAISQELVRMSTPAALAVIRRILVDSVAAFIDSEFLSDSAPVTGESPGGIFNGQQTRVSTGGSAAQITADLNAMLLKLTSWRNVFWIMQPTTAAAIANASAVQFPNIRATQPDGGFLSGLPVLISSNSPKQIGLLDFGGVVLADEGSSRIDVTDQATVVLDDNVSPATTSLVSLWQANKVGVRVERYISWAAANDSIGVLMSVAY